MSTHTIPTSAVQQPTATPSAAPRPRSASTARLLGAGVAAGPIFLLVYALQAVTRDGFDPDRHPLSLLALGASGWVQIANFVVVGALFLACAAGLKRTLTDGPGTTWVPRLIGAIGGGLITAGVFVTDPGAGFPAGAPAGAPEMSWHGALHELGFVVVQVSWVALCFVLRRRFACRGRRGAARACVAAVVAAILIAAVPDPDSFPIRILVVTAIELGFLGTVAARLRDAATVR